MGGRAAMMIGLALAAAVPVADVGHAQSCPPGMVRSNGLCCSWQAVQSGRCGARAACGPGRMRDRYGRCVASPRAPAPPWLR